LRQEGVSAGHVSAAQHVTLESLTVNCDPGTGVDPRVELVQGILSVPLVGTVVVPLFEPQEFPRRKRRVRGLRHQIGDLEAHEGVLYAAKHIGGIAKQLDDGSDSPLQHGDELLKVRR
jgi:hypothetical protein